MRNFWKNRNSNATGKLTRRLAAAKSPQAWPVLEIIAARPTGSVYMSLDVLNVKASRNSFHAARKLKSAVTATAGNERGSTTLVNT